MKPFDVIDHLVSKKRFRLYFDAALNAWKTETRGDEQHLQQYYPLDTYASHLSKAKDVKTFLYLWIKRINIQTKLKWIRAHVSSGKLLDFGAGNSAFALAAQKQGWKVDVFEPYASSRQMGAQDLLNNVSLPLQNQTYDVITLWHVFEHLANPEQQLEQFYQALVPGGFLVLAVPNYSSWDAHHYGAYWAAYDVPRHLWHYNEVAIKRITAKAGFVFCHTQKMFWDAFYISVLSEEYKQTKAAWLLGILKGAYSNIVGYPKNNTSSLAFTLQKPK